MQILAFAASKYSEMRQHFLRFFSCTRQNLLSENSFDLKLMNFCADFGASDEIRLTPIEDDKPKDAENSKFKASSDYLATAKRTA